MKLIFFSCLFLSWQHCPPLRGKFFTLNLKWGFLSLRMFLCVFVLHWNWSVLTRMRTKWIFRSITVRCMLAETSTLASDVWNHWLIQWYKFTWYIQALIFWKFTQTVSITLKNCHYSLCTQPNELPRAFVAVVFPSRIATCDKNCSRNCVLCVFPAIVRVFVSTSVEVSPLYSVYVCVYSWGYPFVHSICLGGLLGESVSFCVVSRTEWQKREVWKRQTNDDKIKKVN